MLELLLCVIVLMYIFGKEKEETENDYDE